MAWTIRRYETVSSTNDIAREAGISGEPQFTAFVAREQTRGRGRRQRSWASPQGGLWMSLLLRPALGVDKWPLIPLATGLAITKSLRELGLTACLKWPNDVEVNGRKIAGILCESVLPGDSGGGFVVTGIGLNVNVPEDRFPEELRGTATSVLAQSGREHDTDVMAQMIMDHVSVEMSCLEAGDCGDLLREWRSMCPMLGCEVVVRGVDGEYEGIARDVSRDGALIVESAGVSIQVRAADVSVRLKEGDRS